MYGISVADLIESDQVLDWLTLWSLAGEDLQFSLPIFGKRRWLEF